MAVSRPGFQSAGATLLAEYGGGSVRPGRSLAFAEASASTVAIAESAPGPYVLRRPRGATRFGRAARPQIRTFTRQQARYVRITAESAGIIGPRIPIRTLSVRDGSAPALDLALCKQATASSALDDASAAGCAVDGNPCTRWLPAARDERPWLRLDLGAAEFFDQVCVVPEPQLHDAAIPGAVQPGFRVEVSTDGVIWTHPEPGPDGADAADAFAAPRIDLGAKLPPCPGGDCEPLHVQADPATWQVFAVNHTAHRVTKASLTARIYEPFGRQSGHIEQQGLVIEPLSVAPGFVVPWQAYLPHTHLLSIQLHDADGALLSEHNC